MNRLASHYQTDLTLVLTRNSDLKINGVNVISSLSEIPDSDKKTFIIGGGEIYTQLIDSCDELLVTKNPSRNSWRCLLSNDRPFCLEFD